MADGRPEDAHGITRRSAMVRALRHRNYRLYFAGQGTSVVGTWITRVATSWLVYRLTGSAAMLGLVGFAGQIPIFLLSPFAGVWVDRLDRYRVLLTTQTAAMAQSFILAALALTGTIQVWHIIVLQVFQGIINAFDTPGRQAFMVQMVGDRADLPNAIALNSSMVNGARLLGPAVAGVLIAAVGEGWCFLLDGFSYIAVIGSLMAMRIVREQRPPRTTRVLEELSAGVRYAFGLTPIRAVLLLMALVSLMGMPYSVLMPVFAKAVLHGGAHTYGFLMGASGLGALTGALYLASRQTVLGLDRVIPGAVIVFGTGLIAFSFSRWLPLSLGLLLFVGAGFMIQMASSNTIIQTLVREEMRGRVMAFYVMSFIGVTPFGSLLGGALATRIGAPHTILIGGAACILGGIAFGAMVPRLRAISYPIYRERGILPPIAAGIGEASALERETIQ